MFSINLFQSEILSQTSSLSVWARMGTDGSQSLLQNGQLAKQCSDPAIHGNLYKIQTNVVKTRNTSLRKGTSWQPLDKSWQTRIYSY